MAEIKLYYFDARGRAEVIRWVLAQAEVKYTDFRFTHEEWPEIKKDIPFGQVPAMKYNGKWIIQSMAIAKFLAREYKLAGKDNVEVAQSDMYLDCITDFLTKSLEIWYEKDEEKKKEITARVKTDNFIPLLKNFTEVLKANGGKYLVGDDVTVADFGLVDIVENLSAVWFGQDWRPDFPELDKYNQEILNLPNIKKWIENRPKTDH